MGKTLIPKPVMIILGLCVLVVVVIVAIREVEYFQGEIHAISHGYFGGDFGTEFQKMTYMMANIFQIGFGIMSSLGFLFPVWAGRKLYRKGFTASAEEIVPKAYRSAGTYLIVIGLLAVVVYGWIMSSNNFFTNDIFLPASLVVMGIIGIIGGIARKA